MRILVTGGAGFIGSALVRHLVKNTEHQVLNLDKLSYAGVLESLDEIANDPRYRFVRGDICDAVLVRDLLHDFQPDVIAHLAAESHVDRSIDGPDAFIQTNVVGTFTMLDQALSFSCCTRCCHVKPLTAGMGPLTWVLADAGDVS